MDDPWTSYRSYPRPPHDISWQHHRAPSDNYYYNMRRNNSFDHSGGSNDQSRETPSFPEYSFNDPSTASMAAPGSENDDSYTVRTSPIRRQQDRKRNREDNDVDSFFQPEIGSDNFDLVALPRITKNDRTQCEEDISYAGDRSYEITEGDNLHPGTRQRIYPQDPGPPFLNPHGDYVVTHSRTTERNMLNYEAQKKKYIGRPYNAMEGDNNVTGLHHHGMSYRMHPPDLGLSYPDPRWDFYQPSLSTWGATHNLQGVHSPSVHYKIGDDNDQSPSTNYASYPDRSAANFSDHRPRQLLPMYNEEKLSQVAASPSSNAFVESITEIKLSPTMRELEVAASVRAQEALHTWYDRLKELHEYIQMNGHTNVPQKYSPNQKLGVWVNKQRMEKKNYDDRKATSMTEEKLEALNNIGFVWAKRKGQHSWDTKYRELREYKKINGDCKCRWLWYYLLMFCAFSILLLLRVVLQRSCADKVF